MKPSSPAQRERARRLLDHEAGNRGAPARASAAHGVYQKLHDHLAPLIGTDGIEALLVRSAKLTQAQFPFVEASAGRSASALRECLQQQRPAVAAEAAAELFGTFFMLITTFIGERLTTQALHGAWPTLEAGTRK